MSAPRSTTARASACGAVAPQSTLMFTPSGSTSPRPWRRSPRHRAPGGAARAVRPIEHDVQPVRPDGACELASMVQVARERLARLDPSAELGVTDPAELRLAPDQVLQLVLDRIVELETVRIEHLQTVVVGWIMRGRHHDPGLVRAAPCQEGERRRGHDADDVDVGAEACRSRDDRCHEHVSRAACPDRPRSRSPARPVAWRSPGRGRTPSSVAGRRWRRHASHPSRTVDPSRQPAGDAEAGTVTVTGTCGGLAATSVTPGGKVAPTTTSLVPRPTAETSDPRRASSRRSDRGRRGCPRPSGGVDRGRCRTRSRAAPRRA